MAMFVTSYPFYPAAPMQLRFEDDDFFGPRFHRANHYAPRQRTAFWPSESYSYCAPRPRPAIVLQAAPAVRYHPYASRMPVLDYWAAERERRNRLLEEERLERALRQRLLWEFFGGLEAANERETADEAEEKAKENEMAMLEDAKKTKKANKHEKREKKINKHRASPTPERKSDDATVVVPSLPTNEATGISTTSAVPAATVPSTSPSTVSARLCLEVNEDGSAYEAKISVAENATVENVKLQAISDLQGSRWLRVSLETEQRNEETLFGHQMVSVVRETKVHRLSVPEDAMLEGVTVRLSADEGRVNKDQTTETKNTENKDEKEELKVTKKELVVRLPRQQQCRQLNAPESASATTTTTTTTMEDEKKVEESASNKTDSLSTPEEAVNKEEKELGKEEEEKDESDISSEVSSEVTVEDVESDDEEEHEK